MTLTLLIFAIALIAMPFQLVQPAQAQLEHSGGTPSLGADDPNLGPLPPGVTPTYTIVTRAYLSFRPNPIGVGQSLLINVWTSPGQYHSFYMCQYKVTIEKPDGSTVVLGPVNSYLGDATAWWEFTVDQPGTWKLKFEQPGTYLPARVYVDRPGTTNRANYTLYTSVLYTASETEWQELTVLPEMVASWPPSPLPTDYWTRPANAMHREWYPILGNYPSTGIYYYGNFVYYGNSRDRFTQYVQGPNSAHVVWKRQDAISGLIGGQAYFYSLGSGGSNPDLVYSGRCYDSYSKPGSGKTTVTYWQCFDLRTGKVYWERPLESGESAPTSIEFNDPQESTTVPGEIAQMGYSISLISISGGYLKKYDPWTGAMTANISISPLTSATFYGDQLAVSIQTIGSGASATYRLINWTTRGTSTNFTSRILNNITWPKSSLGTPDYAAGITVSAGWNSPPGPQWCIGVTMQAVDMRTGAMLWTFATNDTLEDSIQGGQSLVHRGKIAFAAHGRHWTCYDGRTGTKLWTSEQTEYPWGAWWPYNQALIVYNETKSAIITSTYEGVYAIDWDDGKILWHYKDPNSVPFENPYDDTPYFTAVTVADGKVYAFNGEHTQSLPRARDWKIHCINATTGEGIWKMLNPMSPGAVADGYLTASNAYDGHLYVFGKGESTTTVTAPDAAVPLGTAFTIKGTVLDQSPGQPGTPCVSKDSMETQMEYLHLQMPIDGLWHNETITGVPVTLTAIGTDNTVYDLGTVTTNGYYGTFSKAWTPTKEDTYTIIASFEGDESYGSSNAATAVTVGPAPETPETPEIPTPVDNTSLLYGIMVGVIVAIIIGIIAIIVSLRRR